MRFALIAAEKAHHPLQTAVSVLAGDAQWVLRLAQAAGIGARTAGSPAEGVGARLVRGQQAPLRQPADSRDLLEQQVRVSRKRVIRLMQEEGLKARVRKRFKCTTMSDHDQPVAANLLDRQFTADAPNQRWVGDTTEFVIGESGKLYLAAILDLFSRFVVGWAVSAVNDRHLTLKALGMALKRRCPAAGLLHHSDRGSTYASEDYQRMLDAHGITCSMSRTRRLLRQRGDGSVLLDGKDRARRSLR